jgi:LemA protein
MNIYRSQEINISFFNIFTKTQQPLIFQNMIPVILIIIALLIAVFVGSVYNNLVYKKNEVENAYSGMDAMLKKRYDLLPNLLSIVKTYMEHEKSTLVEIAELRTRRMESQITPDEKDSLDVKVGKTMGNMMLSVENYPNLKANTNFIKLQGAWNECEEQIGASRRAYNAAIADYNDAFEMYPGSMFAGRFKFEHKKGFEIKEEERENISAKKLFEGK